MSEKKIIAELKAELVESAQLGFEECRATLNKNCDEDLCTLDDF